jgi:hypothetical protein
MSEPEPLRPVLARISDDGHRAGDEQASVTLGQMQLGFVYFVFLPSIVTTLWAGRAVHRYGTQHTAMLWSGLRWRA